MKKSVIEIQFNWIFILIVGAVILIFFISLVVQQSRLSSKKIEQSVSYDMGSIFSGAKVSVNTEHIVDIPPIDINFECEGGYSGYRVKSSEIPIGDSLIIFSPNYIIGAERKILTWSYDWNVPYRVTNFLFITSTQARYIIDDGDFGDADHVFMHLPESMRKVQIDDMANIDDTNNYKVKIAVFDSNIANPETHVFNVPAAIMDMGEGDVSLVYFDNMEPVDSVLGKGDVYFYMKNGSVFSYVGKRRYVGEASVYGAIYSEKMENYVCNMQKSFKRLAILSDVYKERADALIEYYSVNPDPQNCKSKISVARAYLENMTSIGTYSDSAADALYSNMVGLKNQNKIIQRYSCPVIY